MLVFYMKKQVLDLAHLIFLNFVVVGAYWHVCLYEKVASKVISAEPPGRGNGRDQLGCLTVPGRFHYPSPGAAYSHLAPRLRPYIRCVHQGMGVI